MSAPWSGKLFVIRGGDRYRICDIVPEGEHVAGQNLCSYGCTGPYELIGFQEIIEVEKIENWMAEKQEAGFRFTPDLLDELGWSPTSYRWDGDLTDDCRSEKNVFDASMAAGDGDASMVDFEKSFPGWMRRPGGGDNVHYCLPQLVIETLAKSVFGHLDHEAESAFSQICKENKTIGRLTGRTKSRWLPPTVFQADEPPLSIGRLKEFGFTAAQAAAAVEQIQCISAMREKVKGVAGHMICFKPYRDHLQILRAHWFRLPESHRPDLPFYFPTTKQLEQPCDQLNWVKVPEDFRLKVAEFCKQWELNGINSWEIPNPEGPLFNVSTDFATLYRSPRSVHMAAPSSYPITKNDNIERRMKDSQRHGDDRQDKLPVTTHWEAYGSILEIEHVERVVRARYAGKRGLVKHLLQAMAHHLGVSLDRVRKLRQALRKGVKGIELKASDLR